jgi:hypothetical protein
VLFWTLSTSYGFSDTTSWNLDLSMLSGMKFLLRWAPQKGLVSTSDSTKYDPSYLVTESPVSEKVYLKQNTPQEPVSRTTLICIVTSQCQTHSYVAKINFNSFPPERSESHFWPTTTVLISCYSILESSNMT